MATNIIHRINLIMYAIFPFILFCCNYSNKKVITCSEIEQIGSDTILNNVKFDLYCIYSGIKFSFKKDSLKVIDYSECDLKLNKTLSSDSILEYSLHFYYRGMPILSDDLVKNGNRIIGKILYNTRKHKIVEYISDWNVGFYEENPTSRYFMPLQPDVIAFIKKNAKNINAWFREEAKRRGILTENFQSR